ncbi:MAG: hypothetical protein SGJ00_01845 [bacterium]|nr:hypothetical protein [bacterium]
MIYESEARFNDLIRIVWYAFYFTWTYLLFTDKNSLLNWIKQLAFWSIIILIIQGLFEYYQPYLWTFMLSPNVEKRTVARIAGSLIDSNSYACSMILLFAVYFKEYFNKVNLFKIVYLSMFFLVVIYFNELSGSRQGALIILLFLSYLFFKKMSFQKVKKVLLVFGGLIILFTIFNQQIFDYSESNPYSALGRFLNNSDNKALQSNIDRQNSIYQGILFLSESYFLFGPGILNFASRWANFTSAHEPHIGFLFLLVQFGALTIPIFYIFYLSFLRSKTVKLAVITLALFIHLSLQPNSVYYAITFFVFFYTDIKYAYKLESIGKEEFVQ